MTRDNAWTVQNSCELLSQLEQRQLQEAFAGAQAYRAVGDPGRRVGRLLCGDGSATAGPGCGGSSGGEGRGAGLELVVEEGGFSFDAPATWFWRRGRTASPRRRRRLGRRGGGDGEGGRDVELFFLEPACGEEVDGEIGDEEDVPELQSSFSLASFASPLPSRTSSSTNPMPLTLSPPARRLSGMSGEVSQGIGPVFLSFRGGSNSLKPFRPSFNPGRVDSPRLLHRGGDQA